eukprot:maker-scaffold_13-snap-gene-11.3-mRNA-1 protein AED:0.02 eAED:0.02 QI:0/1/0.5/1/1/1/2/781/489
MTLMLQVRLASLDCYFFSFQLLRTFADPANLPKTLSKGRQRRMLQENGNIRQKPQPSGTAETDNGSTAEMPIKLELFPNERHKVFRPRNAPPSSITSSMGGVLAVQVKSLTQQQLLSELRRHNDMSNDPWTLLHGKVYSLKTYVDHPGGHFDLAKAAGEDCTYLFDEFHKYINPKGFLPQNSFIGNIKNYSTSKFYCPRKMHKNWIPAKISSLSQLPQKYHYKMLLTFPERKSSQMKKLISTVETKSCPFHVLVKLSLNGRKAVVRPLTPLINFTPQKSSPIEEAEDVLVLVIKLYGTGHFSMLLADENRMDLNVEVGFVISHVRFQRNFIRIEGMRGEGKFQGEIKKLGLIGAGTGVLPMIQIVQYLLKNEDVSTELFILICAKKLEDILFLDWWESLKEYGITLTFVLSEERSTNENYYFGSFGPGTFQAFPNCLPFPDSYEDESIRLLLSGPPGFEPFGPRDNPRISNIMKMLLKQGWSYSMMESL